VVRYLYSWRCYARDVLYIDDIRAPFELSWHLAGGNIDDHLPRWRWLDVAYADDKGGIAESKLGYKWAKWVTRIELSDRPYRRSLYMPTARANGLDIAYETFGSSGDRPLILIMGIGSQMVTWPVVFCEKLAKAGHFVVRFDNRDIGLSTKQDDAGIPNIWEVIAAARAGGPTNAPYTLSDMAADTVGLMDALKIKKAHICGLSMGGMIAQTIAIEYQDRVQSLIPNRLDVDPASGS
jgi:hypothetical protein